MNTAINPKRAILTKKSFLTLARVRKGDTFTVSRVPHGTEGGLVVHLIRDGETVDDVTFMVSMVLGVDIEKTQAGIIIPAYTNISPEMLKIRLNRRLRR